jgi:starch-binding outer membrane protein, SusD/RagB family
MKAKILIVLFLGLVMSACEMFTEPDLDNQYTEDRVFKDPAFAEGILLRAYRLLPTDYSFDEVATDDAVSNERGNSYLRMATGEWSPQFNPLDNWGSAYDAIFNINYFLSVADQVEWSWQSPERNALFRKRFTGEALALRGYFYFRLLERFGGVASNGELLGVPLVTEVLDTEGNWEIARSTYQETIDQIHNDFDQAIALLPFEWVNMPGEGPEVEAYNRTTGPTNQNRVNKKIVTALKARVALHAASPAFNPGGAIDQYVIAATMAGALLDSINGVLPSGGLKFYDADADATNSEIFWRGDFSNSNIRELANYPPSMFGNGRVNPTQNLVDAFPMKNGYPIGDAAAAYDPANPYANRDPRLAAYIVYDGNKVGSTTIDTDVNSPVNGINKTPNYSTRTGYYLLKLLRPDVNLNPSATNTRRHFYSHIRYTEIFLIYAEAANEAWGPDADPNGYGVTARQAIQKIRQRAGITQPDNYLTSLTTKEQLRELVRNERRLELSFEGFRFWDLRRWDANLNEPAKAVLIDGTNYNYMEVESRSYPSHATYGPVPLTETLKYDGLLQNQGW